MGTNTQTRKRRDQTAPQLGAQFPPHVHHPKPNSSVRNSFVASGVAPEAVLRVVGHLKDRQTTKVIQGGLTLPSHRPYLWAIYFKQVPTPPNHNMPRKCTLEVFGIGMDDRGNEVTLWRSGGVNVEVLPPGFDLHITWPDGSGTYCGSNFVPYGTYSTAGTITAQLGGGLSAQASSVYQDAGAGFWSAQFDPLPTATGCTLTVTLTGSPPPQTVTGLNFDGNC
jgi:hypothetical protein